MDIAVALVIACVVGAVWHHNRSVRESTDALKSECARSAELGESNLACISLRKASRADA